MVSFGKMEKVITKKTLSLKKERMVKSAIAYLRFKNFHTIKANMSTFDKPQAVFLKASEAGFIPDLIAQKDFGTYVFEVFMTDVDTTEVLCNRWKTYIEYAERKNGKFYLIAYGADAQELQELLDREEVNAKMIRINV